VWLRSERAGGAFLRAVQCDLRQARHGPEARIPERHCGDHRGLARAVPDLGPVFFAVSNKGLLSSQLEKLAVKHRLPTGGQWAPSDLGWALAGEWPAGQQDLPRAFIVCVEELKRQVMALGGDAIVWLRQDVDLDTNGFQWFYMQAYGTAVLRKPTT
jgi:hypothetical protein